MEKREMHFNHTTPHISPTIHSPGHRGYYALIPVVLLLLIGCFAVTVFYRRRRKRLDELRHRLIPLYNYDPAEDQEHWLDETRSDEEEEVSEPLFTYGKLAISSPYGT